MSEWLKEHAWKACVRATVPWVRIPSSPPSIREKQPAKRLFLLEYNLSMKKANETILTYEKYAEIYDDEVVQFWENFPREFFAEFCSGLPGKKILNLGSGTGRDALILKEFNLDVVCVDAARAMTDITSKLGFESVNATFDEFDYKKKSFDGVWAYTSLIHIPKNEAKRIIEKINFALKPGGKFAVGVIEGAAVGMVGRSTMPDGLRYFKEYRREELTSFVSSCGFTIEYEQDYRPNKRVYLSQVYKKAG